jgi:hypothetical protein
MRTRHRQAAALGLALISVLQSQAYGQTRDRFWDSFNSSCLKATGAPADNVIAKKYCECSANAVISQFSFDERMHIAVHMDEDTLPPATEEKLSELAKACRKRAIQ